MKDGIPRPGFAMGEAWFIGKERKMFRELVEKSISELSDSYLDHVLFEIGSGTKSFGHMKEWDEWFSYLLPRLIEKWSIRATNQDGIEQLITTFICLYPRNSIGGLSTFRNEIIVTLPHSIMAGRLWEEWIDQRSSQETKRPVFLKSGFGQAWTIGKAENSLSAALVFCLKYLNPDEIESWVQSMLAIEDPYWRAALIIWLSAVDELSEEFEVTYPMIASAPAKIEWNYSFILDPRGDPRKDTASTAGENLLPLENRKVFLRGIRTTLTEDIYLSWIDSISAVSELSKSMSYHLDLFFERFVRS
jgi:hypothetical protein